MFIWARETACVDLFGLKCRHHYRWDHNVVLFSETLQNITSGYVLRDTVVDVTLVMQII